MEKYEIVSALFHGFDYEKYFTSDTRVKMQIIRDAEEHVLQQEDGKNRCLKYVNELSKAFSLAVPNERL